MSIQAELAVMTFNQALGMTIDQYMFYRKETRTALGAKLDLSQSTVSRKISGKVPWTVEEVALAARELGVEVQDLMPESNGDGGWVPAAFNPAHAKGPAPTGTGPSSAVAGAGVEPTTSGL